MSQSTLEMTKDLVSAQIQSGTLLPEEVPNAIRHIYQNLLTLKSRQESGFPVPAPVAETLQSPAD